MVNSEYGFFIYSEYRETAFYGMIKVLRPDDPQEQDIILAASQPDGRGTGLPAADPSKVEKVALKDIKLRLYFTG